MCEDPHMKYCPKCKSDSYIYDSRIKDGMVIRRRICQKCKHKWMTIEINYWDYEKLKEGDNHSEFL